MHSPPKLLLATTNRDKIREIAAVLEGVPFQLRTLADFPAQVAPEETGRTFADNARAKALYYNAALGELTVAEDSGLEIDALGGAPGVESARYGGADTPYPEKFARLYEALRARNGLGSPARFVCALALVDDGRVLFEARGTIEGRIADAPRGEGGFGYDPIFFYPPFGATLAEAADRKSTVSHRGKAFRELRDFLAEGSGFTVQGSRVRF
jgi:XTP/dITP diphosphohydrolase